MPASLRRQVPCRASADQLDPGLACVRGVAGLWERSSAHRVAHSVCLCLSCGKPSSSFRPYSGIILIASCCSFYKVRRGLFLHKEIPHAGAGREFILIRVDMVVSTHSAATPSSPQGILLLLGIPSPPCICPSSELVPELHTWTRTEVDGSTSHPPGLSDGAED